MRKVRNMKLKILFKRTEDKHNMMHGSALAKKHKEGRKTSKFPDICSQQSVTACANLANLYAMPPVSPQHVLINKGDCEEE